MATPEIDHNTPTVEALRVVTPEDVEDFQRLSPQLTGKATPPLEVVEAHLRAAVDNPDARVLAIRVERRVQATAMAVINHLSIAGPKAWIEDVVTDQKYQGRGFAGLLMD